MYFVASSKVKTTAKLNMLEDKTSEAFILSPQADELPPVNFVSVVRTALLKEIIMRDKSLRLDAPKSKENKERTPARTSFPESPFLK